MAQALNVSSRPVLIDDEAHQLDGGARGEVNPDDARVKRAVEIGTLRLEAAHVGSTTGTAERKPEPEEPFGHLPKTEEG